MFGKFTHRRLEALKRDPNRKGDWFKEDKLKASDDRPTRLRLATNIIRLALYIEDPLKIMLNGAWGSGKTWFMEELGGMLSETTGFKIVEINAWKIDYTPDPFIPFASDIKDALNLDNVVVREIGKITRALAQSSTIGFSGEITGIPIKFGFSGYRFSQAIKSNEKYATEQFIQYREIEKARKVLQDGIRTALRPNKDGPQRLVILIDELDRCEPRFAITLLERIKHFFETEGVIVICSVDKEQLCASIKSAFGSDYSADKYLHRLFDHEISLPWGGMGQFAQNELCRRMSNVVSNKDLGEPIGRCFSELCRIREYSTTNYGVGIESSWPKPYVTARDVIRISNRISIMASSLDPKNAITWAVSMALIVITEFGNKGKIINLIETQSRDWSHIHSVFAHDAVSDTENLIFHILASVYSGPKPETLYGKYPTSDVVRNILNNEDIKGKFSPERIRHAYYFAVQPSANEHRESIDISDHIYADIRHKSDS